MIQEFEWHEIDKDYDVRKDAETACWKTVAVDKNGPSEPGRYLVLTNNGAVQVKRYDGERFAGRYGHAYLAWAEIPSADHLNIISKDQKQLNDICEQIKTLEEKKRKLEHKIYEINRDADKDKYNRAKEQVRQEIAAERKMIGDFVIT